MAIIINCNKSLVLRLTWREDKVPTNDKKEGKILTFSHKISFTKSRKEPVKRGGLR